MAAATAESGLDRKARSRGVTRSRSPPALNDSRPIFPLLSDLSQDTAHHRSRSHQAVSLAFENAHLTATHGLAQPLDIIHRHAGIFTTVLNHDRPSDIHIPEPNRLAALQADQQVNSRVRIRSSELPDPVCKPGVIVLLAFKLLFRGLGARAKSGVALPG